MKIRRLPDQSGNCQIGQVAAGSKSGTSHHCGSSSRRLVHLIPAPLNRYQGWLYQSFHTSSTLPPWASFFLSAVLPGTGFLPLLGWWGCPMPTSLPLVLSANSHLLSLNTDCVSPDLDPVSSDNGSMSTSDGCIALDFGSLSAH